MVLLRGFEADAGAGLGPTGPTIRTARRDATPSPVLRAVLAPAAYVVVHQLGHRGAERGGLGVLHVLVLPPQRGGCAEAGCAVDDRQRAPDAARQLTRFALLTGELVAPAAQLVDRDADP